MAGRNLKPLDEAEDLELKELKLELLDVWARFDLLTDYITGVRDEEILALIGLPKAEQKKGLRAIARKVAEDVRGLKNGR